MEEEKGGGIMYRVEKGGGHEKGREGFKSRTEEGGRGCQYYFSL